MKKLWFSLILIVLLLGVTFSTVFAQTYRFQVQRADVNLYVNTDGSVSIEYTLDFVNDAGVSPIDFIDIGTPNDNYVLSTITADVDGKTINDIQTSQYVPHGVALGLGSNAIQPGQSGTVHVLIGKLTGILYPGTQQESESYASLEFSPNYFDSQYVHGSTNMTVTLFLPAGMTDQEPRYFNPQSWPGDNAPQSGFDDQGRAFYRWNADNANSSTEYIFGASFPARLVPSDVLSTPPSSSTSVDVSGFLSTLTNSACCLGFGALFIGIFGLSIYQGTIGAAKRKLQYLPPKISIEGHGIKRGLTAVEAAILMEQPMDKIMTMILFSVVKKGAATVETREPLKISVTDPQPEGLQAYELDFLNAFKVDDEKKRRVAMQDLMINLVKSVTAKIKGFSLKETVVYYQSIIDKAWQHVQAADTPEVQVKNLEEAFDWTLLDRNYEDRSRQVYNRPIFIPMWWGRFDPGVRPATIQSTAAPISPSMPGQNVSLPHLPGSDFAASVVKNVQNFSANAIGNLTDFTHGVTSKTNPVPKTSYRSSGGGGHCACACACAGCACACAGGGR
jgi:hypothetical protein